MDVIEVLKAKTDGMPDEVVITLTTQQAKALLDQLEAVRQRAADLSLNNADLHHDCTVYRGEIAELKAKLAIANRARRKNTKLRIIQND